MYILLGSEQGASDFWKWIGRTPFNYLGRGRPVRDINVGASGSSPRAKHPTKCSNVARKGCLHYSPPTIADPEC